jgi:hypothetical protein
MLANPGHDWTEAQKNAVRRETLRLVLDGIILKLPCAQCGRLKVDAHHPDYRFPRIVVWLCRKHHRQIHGATRPAGETLPQRRARLLRKTDRPPTKRDLELAELQALIHRYEDRP